jgi:hypothetical protein
VFEGARRVLRDFRRGFERYRVAHLKGRRQFHLRCLRLHGGDDLVAAMPRVHGPQPRDPVENAPAIVGGGYIPVAPDISRGAFLNCPFAVNGIQIAAMSSVVATVVAELTAH